MGRFIDLTGKRFGYLTVIKRVDDNVLPSGQSEIMWLCMCDCGNFTTVRSFYLRNGHTKSCGCLKYETSDFTGQVINGIKIIKMLPKSKKGELNCECLCHCGNIFTTRLSSLKNNHTKSCGCRKKQLRIQDMVGKKFGKLTVLHQGLYEFTKFDRRFIRWVCQCDCGRQALVRGVHLRNGHSQSCGCKRLEVIRSASNGEIWISEYLSEMGLMFESQKTYSTLVGFKNGLLSFDFCIKKDKHQFLIECQGEQHYKPIDYFGGAEMFKIQQQHDELKRKYVSAHPNMTLIELPYRNNTSKSELLNLLNAELIKYSII